MWLAGAESFDLYLGAAAGGIAQGGRRTGWNAHTDVAAGAAQWFKAARQLQGGWRRPCVRVWLSGAMARPFVVGPIQGLSGWREAHAFAEASAPEATGLVGPCIVYLDQAPDMAAGIAVAVERSLIEMLSALAQGAGVRMATVQPWWGRAITDLVGNRSEFMLLTAEDEDSVTLLSLQADRWIAASSQAPLPAPAQLDRLLDRRAVAAGARRDQILRVGINFDADVVRRIWPSAPLLVAAVAIP